MKNEDFYSEKFTIKENVNSTLKTEIDEINLHAAFVCGDRDPNYSIKLATYIQCKHLKDNDTKLSILTAIGLDDPGEDVFKFTEELRDLIVE